MKLSNLPTQAIEKIKSYRWDGIIEKHEGPENWDFVLEYYNYAKRHPDDSNAHNNLGVICMMKRRKQ